MSYPNPAGAGKAGAQTPSSTDSRDETLADAFAGTSRTIVPIVAEELTIGKRVVETETLRVHKGVGEREETVDIPLMREEITVQTIAVNREVTGDIPAVRQEGETTIIPILREELVVRKALFLAEEIHIRRERREMHTPQTVTLRHETAQIERVEAGSAEASPTDGRQDTTGESVHRTP